MAKTLVALYDTFTDAEHVVQELIEDGFSRSDIHLALDHTKSRTAHTSSVEWDSAYEGANLLDTLADLGVPYDEAHAYAEGVRRGGALVVVESSDDRAERGMEILRRLHPVDIHERTAQWRHEGWTGYDANAITSTPTSSAATTARRAPGAGALHDTCGGQGSAHTTRRGPRRGRDSCGARRHHHRQTGGRARPCAHLQPRHRATGRRSGAPARGEGHGRTPAGRPPSHRRRLCSRCQGGY